jgi:hypothetical protein
MFIYFYLLDARFFHEQIAPALARSFRLRTFRPTYDLCQLLLTEKADIPPDSLIHAVLAGLPFERVFWHGLVGECLVQGARAIPRIATAPASLCCLPAPDNFGNSDMPRADYAPIQQAHYGTRELRCGAGFYRPDHAGLNDEANVEQLAGYLESVDTDAWTPGQLKPIRELADDAARAEELAFVRDWWPSLVELYQDARARNWVVVCEDV